MIVQPPSLYETPNNQRGTYVDGIFSNQSGKWYSWVYELFSNYLNRTIYKSDKNNYTGFFDKRDNSISLSLDLATISSPNEYLLSFWAEDDSKIRDKVCSKVFVQIKGENNVMFGNPTVLVREALYNLGNYSQTIQYYEFPELTRGCLHEPKKPALHFHQVALMYVYG